MCDYFTNSGEISLSYLTVAVGWHSRFLSLIHPYFLVESNGQDEVAS
jgi:hypothetical protein